MTHVRFSPVVVVFSALTLTASPIVASAATSPAQDKVLDVVSAGWSPTWLKDGRSYVDDGFRAPLDQLMADRDRTPPGRAFGHLLDSHLQSQSPSGSRAASTRGGIRAMAGARGGAAFGGVGGGGRPLVTAGLGSDVSSEAKDGILPDLNGPTDAIDDLLENFDPGSEPSGGNSNADPAAPQLLVTPLPASAMLLIAGLGGLVPLMLRRRLRIS